jgi:3-hydroxyisobutyrate dehydrogenase-like beta-hydroxyacid dehydrogenase
VGFGITEAAMQRLREAGGISANSPRDVAEQAEVLITSLPSVAGLYPALVLNVIGDSAGPSRMFQRRGPIMVAGQYDEPTATMTTFERHRHH